jgi:hypothetical protein
MLLPLPPLGTLPAEELLGFELDEEGGGATELLLGTELELGLIYEELDD